MQFYYVTFYPTLTLPLEWGGILRSLPLSKWEVRGDEGQRPMIFVNMTK